MASIAEVASLAYHEITDDPTSTGFQRPGARRFVLSPAAFTGNLNAIAASALRPALVTDVELSQPQRHVLLTFDDGGQSALYAAQELARRGWRGHFFVVTSLIGSRTFLSSRDVRDLHGAGHLIGSHSHTHPSIFRELSPTRMRDEWRVSADRLSSIVGVPCTAASVPGGDISQAVLESAERAGVRYLFTIEPQLRPRRVGQCWVLGRYTVRTGTAPELVGSLVNFHGWTRALAVRRLKVVARYAAPALYRRLVRYRTAGWDETLLTPQVPEGSA